MEIIKKEIFLIHKIEKEDKGVMFYSGRHGDEIMIFIDNNQINGKIKTKWIWPWKKRKLELFTIEYFIVRAYLDGEKLFEIPFEEYPENIKKIAKKINNINP